MEKFQSFLVEIPWFLPNSKDCVGPTQPRGKGSKRRILGLVLWPLAVTRCKLCSSQAGENGASGKEPCWDFAFSGICPSLNGILLWFLPSSNKQKAPRFTLGLCSHVQTAWGPSQLFKKPPCQRGTGAPIYMDGSVCVYTHIHYAE